MDIYRKRIHYGTFIWSNIKQHMNKLGLHATPWLNRINVRKIILYFRLTLYLFITSICSLLFIKGVAHPWALTQGYPGWSWSHTPPHILDNRHYVWPQSSQSILKQSMLNKIKTNMCILRSITSIPEVITNSVSRSFTEKVYIYKWGPEWENKHANMTETQHKPTLSQREKKHTKKETKFLFRIKCITRIKGGYL